MSEFVSTAQLRAARAMLGWTTQRLAVAAQVHRQSIGDIEKGRVQPQKGSKARLPTPGRSLRRTAKTRSLKHAISPCGSMKAARSATVREAIGVKSEMKCAGCGAMMPKAKPLNLKAAVAIMRNGLDRAFCRA
jgi:hypothetical protein